VDVADTKIDRASFGVAGPVVQGRATATNLPWRMEEQHLQRALDLEVVRLLNDLEAIARAVPFLEDQDLHTLHKGEAEPEGTIGVIAPGTGLGEAFLTWDGSRYQAFASEGGHTDFGPVGAFQVGLLQYMEERCEHVSYERLCSGRGLPNIYAYAKDSGYAPEPEWLAAKLVEINNHGDDPTPVIVEAALDQERPCELCIKTLQTFVAILGAEAGNLALKMLATGGIYLGGGIPPRILPALKEPSFFKAFRRKGRLSKLLQRVPLHVIMNPKAALLGAACHGLGL
jgi:glucokinase